MGVDCIWSSLPKCKTARQNYRPTPNGCGPQSQMVVSIISNVVAREFIHCCNQHDLCYSSCGVPKATCDHQFRECMLNTCHLDIVCRMKAFSMFTAVSRPSPLSCQAYIVAQHSGCDCTWQKIEEQVAKRKTMKENGWKLEKLIIHE
ncbi:hypothetical protein FDP41_006824 [Naegleria fowleri]|uniref:Phospholipase A2 domain-containing protein n=1 Tax=Naegleria fowleri TaxID=5763 RepID=A0A6A5BJK3_NAEFO|nr:uncharacterized protein FDP41_006824 [Naegleria fowleri]KAF0974214.1 hypothetical protein FDP41_006824 [Naegleria fowleri]CAG4717607.1 unnamed protein product [Naegleria fowleri]